MRPRVFPAEDVVDQVRGAGADERASMRPRVFPAEDIFFFGPQDTADYGFNEAAGIPRGRLSPGIPASAGACASMRPRVFPAEDVFPG